MGARLLVVFALLQAAECSTIFRMLRSYPKLEKAPTKVFFNQDKEYLVRIEDDGFSVYLTKSTQRIHHREYRGELKIVEMYFQTNMFMIVERSQPKSVLVFDDYTDSVKAQIDLESDVLAIRMTRDWLLIATASEALIYSILDLRLCGTYPSDNPNGILANSGSLTALPASDMGQIALINLQDFTHDHEASFEVLVRTVAEHAVTGIAVSEDGARMATASEKGTVIRIWDVSTGNRLQELFRGTEPAMINDMNFHANSEQLCVASEKEEEGTVHIFNLCSVEVCPASPLVPSDPTGESLPRPDRSGADSPLTGAKLPDMFLGRQSSITRFKKRATNCLFDAHSDLVVAVDSSGDAMYFCEYNNGPRCDNLREIPFSTVPTFKDSSPEFNTRKSLFF